MSNRTFAIIGGGIAGSVIAGTAVNKGWDVSFFYYGKEITPS